MDSTHYNPNALTELRRTRGVSRDQVAKAVNLHRQTIYRAEKGQNIPYKTLCVLADYYGVEVVRLLYPRPAVTSAVA